MKRTACALLYFRMVHLSSFYRKYNEIVFWYLLWEPAPAPWGISHKVVEHLLQMSPLEFLSFIMSHSQFISYSVGFPTLADSVPRSHDSLYPLISLILGQQFTLFSYLSYRSKKYWFVFSALVRMERWLDTASYVVLFL